MCVSIDMTRQSRVYFPGGNGSPVRSTSEALSFASASNARPSKIAASPRFSVALERAASTPCEKVNLISATGVLTTEP